MPRSRNLSPATVRMISALTPRELVCLMTVVRGIVPSHRCPTWRELLDTPQLRAARRKCMADTKRKKAEAANAA